MAGGIGGISGGQATDAGMATGSGDASSQEDQFAEAFNGVALSIVQESMGDIDDAMQETEEEFSE